MRTLKKEIWPYRVHVTSEKEADDIEVWLGKNLGQFRTKWNAVYGMLGTDYYFKYEHDATFFSLRWL